MLRLKRFTFAIKVFSTLLFLQLTSFDFPILNGCTARQKTARPIKQYLIMEKRNYCLKKRLRTHLAVKTSDVRECKLLVSVSPLDDTQHFFLKVKLKETKRNIKFKDQQYTENPQRHKLFLHKRYAPIPPPKIKKHLEYVHDDLLHS